MLDSKIELLRELPIFTGLSEKQLHSIVSVSAKAFFESGDTIICKDEAGDRAFVILSGSARCMSFLGIPSYGADLGPGTLLGELAMLVQSIHTLTIQAKERLRAMSIHRDALFRVMEREPAIAQQIADNLLVRLRALGHELRHLDGRILELEMRDAVSPGLGRAVPSTPALSVKASPGATALQKEAFSWKRQG